MSPHTVPCWCADRGPLGGCQPRRRDRADAASQRLRPLRRTQHDRAAAISETLQQAGSNDIVLIAGKGHETVQIIGDKSLPFSDRERVMALQREWSG